MILSLLYIQKLREKHAQDVERFKTLQDIVESEIEAGTTLAKNSATDALLWLKRFVKKKLVRVDISYKFPINTIVHSQ